MHVAIIGVGRVGAALAYTLMLSGLVDRLDVVDIIPGLPFALREDLYHSATFLGLDIEINAYEDSSLVEGADIIILAAGKARTKEASRRELAEINFRIIGSIMESVVDKNPDALYFVVANPVDALSTFVSDFVGDKVFGTGTILETVRLRSFLVRKLGLSINDVYGFVGGEHGEDAVILWSTVRVKGKPLEDFVGSSDAISLMKDAENYVKTISKKIIEGQGATIWGPAMAFSELLINIVKNSGKIMSYTVPTELPGLNRKVHVTIPREASIKPRFSLWNYLGEEEQKGIIKAAERILETYERGLTAYKKGKK